jgi:hypothetical protein
VRLEGLGKLKKKMHLIGTPTRDFPACSIVTQPITQLRAPSIAKFLLIFGTPGNRYLTMEMCHGYKSI